MTRKIYILLMTFGVVACSTTSQIPLDDAYYRPENTVVLSSPAPDKRPEVKVSPATPKMEVLHQQDTTITVRIKR